MQVNYDKPSGFAVGTYTSVSQTKKQDVAAGGKNHLVKMNE